MDDNDVNEIEQITDIACKIAASNLQSTARRTVQLKTLVAKGFVSAIEADSLVLFGIDPNKIELGITPGNLVGFHTKEGEYIVAGQPPYRFTKQEMEVKVADVHNQICELLKANHTNLKWFVEVGVHDEGEGLLVSSSMVSVVLTSSCPAKRTDNILATSIGHAFRWVHESSSVDRLSLRCISRVQPEVMAAMCKSILINGWELNDQAKQRLHEGEGVFNVRDFSNGGEASRFGLAGE